MSRRYPDLPAVANEQLELYVARLLEWGPRVNLVGPALLGDPWTAIDEALVALRWPAPVRLVDLGSGGGLPAIPLAIGWATTTVTLVEPRERRWAFLRSVVAELKLEATVKRCRFEDLANEGEDEWDAVSARGLAGIGQAVDRLRPSLPPGFRLFWFTGPESAEESPTECHLVEQIAVAEGGRRLLLFQDSRDVPRGT